MTFQKPYRGSEHELRETLRRGEARTGEEPAPVTTRGVLVTVAWVAILVAIGFVLVGTGIIDPSMCHGTLNPASC